MKLKLATRGLAGSVFCSALLAASYSAAPAIAAGTARAASAAPACTTVIAKVRATHWVWLKETRKIHGRRVYVRRHGKIVRRHVRVRYLKAEPELLCTTPALAALTPPSPVPVAPSAPASSPPTVAPTPPQPPVNEVQAPVNSGPPSISGFPRAGQPLSANPGAWSGAPASYAYQWQECDASGEKCKAISGASASTYVPGEAQAEAKAGATLRVAVSAENSAGSSAAVRSAQTGVVTPSTTTFGKTTVGPHADKFSPDRKRVNSYALPNPALVSKLSIYLQPSGTEGEQKLKGLIYTDSVGKPGELKAVSAERVYKTSERGGWYDLTFPTPVKLAAGNYWIGVITGEGAGVAGYRFEIKEGSREANANLYTQPPTTPFGTATTDYQQMSIYATYTSEAKSSPPHNTEPPTISGIAESGQHLSASPGAWSESPDYAYQWESCNSTGGNCSAISGATTSTYALAVSDVGKTVRVSVRASDPGGTSAPVTSSTTPEVISSSGAHHLEYVLNDELISVYDMDRAWTPAGTISLPQAVAGIRGVMVSPSTHMMFISYGGDSVGNGTGSVLAYDLESDRVTWDVKLATGIDSGAVSPDGKLLYMPEGENSKGTAWNILNAETGEPEGKIEDPGGLAPHNTIASKDGKYVYMGPRYGEYLGVYNTSTHAVSHVGPLEKVGEKGTVRPFTVNGSNTIAFTTATEFDGFQVSSITKGTALSTVAFQDEEELKQQKEKEEKETAEGKVPAKFPDSGLSHGISLSPNETELYVVDAVHKAVQAYSVPSIAKLEEGVKPTQLATIKVPGEGLAGIESPCAYDCGRGGWLQRSVNGRFVFVGDSGAVIDTETKTIVTTLSTLLNTKMSIEIDWENGAPVATSGRTGVGEK
jgi:sugar lactone lactonase YvrE